MFSDSPGAELVGVSGVCQAGYLHVSFDVFWFCLLYIYETLECYLFWLGIPSH